MIVHCIVVMFLLYCKYKLCAYDGILKCSHSSASSLRSVPLILLREQRFHCCCGSEEERINVNDRVIPVSRVDGRISAPQGIFGLGRQERLKGMRLFADPGSPSGAWVGFASVCQESFLGSDVLRGGVSEVLSSFGV